MSLRYGFHSVTTRIVVEDMAPRCSSFGRCLGRRVHVERGRPVKMLIVSSLVMVSSADRRDPFQVLVDTRCGLPTADANPAPTQRNLPSFALAAETLA
jgi:hypothetical protein